MKVHSAVDFDPNKRERILNAAAELIVRNGLQSSMSAIAEAAGVATGSLYNYFKSKEDMVAALYEQLADDIADAIVREIDPASSHRERLMRYVDDYIDFIWDDAQRAFLFEYLSSLPAVPPAELRKVFTRVSDYGDTLLIEAQQAGAVRDMPHALMGAMIGGTIRNCLKWRRRGPAKLAAEERRSIALMCWNAIAVEPDMVGPSPQPKARTSTGARQATAALRPHASASSMLAASSIQKPPMCSLVSMYGPSVTSRSPPDFVRTDTASRAGTRPPAKTRTPAAFISTLSALISRRVASVSLAGSKSSGW